MAHTGEGIFGREMQKESPKRSMFTKERSTLLESWSIPGGMYDHIWRSLSSRSCLKLRFRNAPHFCNSLL
jgi:hypothetical protein